MKLHPRLMLLPLRLLLMLPSWQKEYDDGGYNRHYRDDDGDCDSVAPAPATTRAGISLS